jgi:glycerol-3-phosphate cytidylyltransferase
MKSSIYPIVVYTSGTFDLFHVGHLNILQRSKKLGDILIVGVSTDELVKSYKKRKPIVPLKDRMRIIENCRCVDKVIVQRRLLDIEDLKRYNVSTITIGDDWKTKHLKGLDWARKHGKKVVYFPYTTSVSTTEIRKAIVNGWQEDKNGSFGK